MLGSEIKKYIEEKGLKQKKVAEDAGMKQQTLNDILNERRKVEAMEYFSLCRSLDLPLEYFASRLQENSEKTA